MKKRLGFVSNSSSSSFICDVCGHDESGWDLGLSEAGMKECCNGHIFCTDHFIEPADADVEKIATKYLNISKKWYEGLVDSNTPDDDYNYKKLKEVEDTLKEIQGKDADEIKDICQDIFYEDYEVPEEFCPLCTLSEVSNEVLVDYLLARGNISYDDAIAEIKSSFNSISEMSKENLKVHFRKLRMKGLDKNE